MMIGSKAALAATIALALATPLAAQQPAAPGKGGPSGSASVAPAKVQQAGAALRDVTAIRETYTPQIASAKNDGEKQALQQRAMDDAAKAINDKGLSVDQYNDVMRAAQADPALGEQVLSAARAPK
jgi:hypothetical protein